MIIIEAIDVTQDVTQGVTQDGTQGYSEHWEIEK
jgi:hypothetical protein